MPVFGACFFARSFCRYAKVQRLCERAKGNACFYSLSCECIYNVRAFIYNKQFIIPSSPFFFSFFFVFLPFPPYSYFANLRPIVQLLANSQIMKPLNPPFCPYASLCASFFGFVFFCSLLFRLPLSVARTDPSVFPSLVSLFSVEHIS